MQSVRVVSPASSPQNPGASQAHALPQSLDWTLHVLEPAFQTHMHDPEQGAGVVVVDVVAVSQQVRRSTPASASSGVGSDDGGWQE